MTDMQTSVTGTVCNRFRTVWLERFMMNEHVPVSTLLFTLMAAVGLVLG